LEIVRPELHEASAMGAAALCGTAVGVVDDPYKVLSSTGLKETRFFPSLKAVKQFKEKFSRYRKLNEEIGRFETN